MNESEVIIAAMKRFNNCNFNHGKNQASMGFEPMTFAILHQLSCEAERWSICGFYYLLVLQQQYNAVLSITSFPINFNSLPFDIIYSSQYITRTNLLPNVT